MLYSSSAPALVATCGCAGTSYTGWRCRLVRPQACRLLAGTAAPLLLYARAPASCNRDEASSPHSQDSLQALAGTLPLRQRYPLATRGNVRGCRPNLGEPRLVNLPRHLQDDCLHVSSRERVQIKSLRFLPRDKRKIAPMQFWGARESSKAMASSIRS